MIKIINNIDLNLHKLLNALFNPLTQTQINALSLTTDHKGYLVFNLTETRFEYWDGAAWQQFGTSYSLPLAGSNRGGIKAATKGVGDTVEVKIDGDTEILYVPTYPVPPVKATGAEIITGTDDAKFATAKAIADSDVLRKGKDGQVAAYTEKTTPADADVFVEEDSADSNKKKKVSWANIKLTLKAYFDGLYNFYSLPRAGSSRGGIKAATKDETFTVEAKIDESTEKIYVPTYPVLPVKATGAEIITGTDDAKFATAKAIADSDVLRKGKDGQVAAYDDKATPVDADVFLEEDSADSNKKKKVSWANIKATLKTYFDGIYQAIFWTRTGTKLSPTNANDVLEVVTNDTTAIKGESSKVNGYGVKGKASLGVAVDGEGLVGGNFKGAVTAIQALVESAGTNDVMALGNFSRKSTGTPAANMGGSIPVFLQNAAGSSYEAMRIEVIQTDATAAAETTQIAIYGRRGGTYELWMTLLGTGQVKFHNYGAGSIAGTLAMVAGFTSSGETIEVPPEELQTEYFGIGITDSAEYIGRNARYNRTTECNRSTDQQMVIKKNEFRLGEWTEFYQKGLGKIYLLKETVEITGATTPAGVNCRYHVTGQENGKDSYYNGVQGKRIYWDTDRWKVVTTIGGSVDFERVDANVLGAYTAVNGTGSPTAADCSSQIAFEGETTSNGQYTTLRMVCTDATTNANKFRVERYADTAYEKIPEFIRTITDETYTLVAADIGNIVTVNRATSVTITIPVALMKARQQIGFEIIGAGQLILAVADGAKQTINTAKKSLGQDSFLLLYCRDHTTDAEIYKVIGGAV